MSNNDDVVDILLSTYNGEPFLRDLLDSIIDQTHSKWRLVIRDDGSCDKTKEILKDYKDKLGKKIEIIEGGHVGPYESFSELTKHVRSPYIMFCDQDDIWLPNKIELSLTTIKKIEKQKRNFPVLVYTDMRIISADGNVLFDNYKDYSGISYDSRNEFCKMLSQPLFFGCTAMFNKALYERCFPWPSHIPHDTWTVVVASALGHVEYIPEAGLLYRRHKGNFSKFPPKNIIAYIWFWLSNIKDVKLYLRERRYVAYELKRRYNYDLPREIRVCLDKFITFIETKNVFLRYQLMREARFMPSGWIKTVVFCLFV